MAKRIHKKHEGAAMEKWNCTSEINSAYVGYEGGSEVESVQLYERGREPTEAFVAMGSGQHTEQRETEGLIVLYWRETHVKLREVR